MLDCDLDIMQEKVNHWLEVSKVGIVDLDLTNVPQTLVVLAGELDYIIPILKCIQSPNAKVPEYINQIRECMNIDYELNNPLFTVRSVLECDLDDEKRSFIIELKIKADEERRLKDLYAQIHESYMGHKIPITRYKQANNDKGVDKFYITAKDESDEYEFIDDKIFRLKQLLLNKYSSCITTDTKSLLKNFAKYLSFIIDFLLFQKFWFKCDDFISLNFSEFQREFNIEVKKINLNENIIF